jgi:DNA polymerase I-like protein with 3'-5' exonuclease and polymerase domains
VTAYGGNPKNPAADLWRVPARYAGPYATQDTVATLGLWRQYEGALRAQDVWSAYRTEIELIPMVVAMRRRGIRVNTTKAMQSAKHFREESKRLIAMVGDRIAVGRALTIDDFRSPAMLAKLFQAENLNFPRTEKTNQPSFKNEWMDVHPHWLPQAVTKIRTYEDSASKFFETFLLRFAHRGRIHAEVHQFKSDEGGTRSHRFSYSDPPLQQAPSPDKSVNTGIGLAFRDCFEPEPGQGWGAFDFSSQEPRITVHFAAACKCSGVDHVVQEYRNNPRTDYHKVVAEMIGKPRPIAKIFNLAMTYGKGIRSIAEELNCSVAEAEALSKDYHSRLPYIKELENLCKRRAGERGYIRLIDGARMRYPFWEGPYMEADERLAAQMAGHKLTSCSLEEAQARQSNPDHPWHGRRLRRADTRTALNNLVQGSAARQTKKAMLEMWRQGILPMIQMHDEVGVGVSSQKEVDTISSIMIETTPLVIPVVVDAEIGPTWGKAKLSWQDYEAQYRSAA